MSREEDALICQLVFGRKVEFIPEQPSEYALDETSPLGFRTNFCGAVFTADRDWLVDDWLDVDENREVPHYTRDPAEDYSVLVKVRGTWSDEDMNEFSRQVCKQCKIRCGTDYVTEGSVWIFLNYYSPGSYSRAALAVLKAKEPATK
jgi:hypothetical protein